ncbi:hypothetical protein ACFTAO_07145 [Paenibacillus rhizoplanae]
MDFTTQLLIAAISAGTPLLLATLGGILTERAGIIQLGAEGLMLMGGSDDLYRLHPQRESDPCATLSDNHYRPSGHGSFVLMCHTEGQSDDVGPGDDAVRQRT